MAYSSDDDFDGFPGLRSDWLGSERDPFDGVRVSDDAAVVASENKTELDLGMLWKMIEERHNKTMKHAQNNTWGEWGYSGYNTVRDLLRVSSIPLRQEFREKATRTYLSKEEKKP